MSTTKIVTVPPEYRRRRPRGTRSPITTILQVVVGIIMIIPVWWGAVTSLRPSSEAFRFLDPLQLQTFFPLRASFDNYFALVESDLGRATLNSIIVSGTTVTIGVVTCAMAAYALSAIEFPGRNAVFVVVLISFLIPFDAIAMPLADVVRDWGLVNTYVGLILPGIGNGMAILLIRTFFLAIPHELVEAARLDGLGWFAIFWRIYVPLAVPSLIGAGLTLFLFQWQAYLWPLLVGTDKEHMLAPIALANFMTQTSIDYGVLFAGSICLTVIPLIILFSLQRYFIQSTVSSGIK